MRKEIIKELLKFKEFCQEFTKRNNKLDIKTNNELFKKEKEIFFKKNNISQEVINLVSNY